MGGSLIESQSLSATPGLGHGNVTIQGLPEAESGAAESVTLSGGSSLVSTTFSSGDGGRVAITARSLTMEGPDTTINASTNAEGRGGDIVVRVQQRQSLRRGDHQNSHRQRRSQCSSGCHCDGARVEWPHGGFCRPFRTWFRHRLRNHRRSSFWPRYGGIQCGQPEGWGRDPNRCYRLRRGGRGCDYQCRLSRYFRWESHLESVVRWERGAGGDHGEYVNSGQCFHRDEYHQ